MLGPAIFGRHCLEIARRGRGKVWRTARSAIRRFFSAARCCPVCDSMTGTLRCTGTMETAVADDALLRCLSGSFSPHAQASSPRPCPRNRHSRRRCGFADRRTLDQPFVDACVSVLVGGRACSQSGDFGSSGSILIDILKVVAVLLLLSPLQSVAVPHLLPTCLAGFGTANPAANGIVARLEFMLPSVRLRDRHCVGGLIDRMASGAGGSPRSAADRPGTAGPGFLFFLRVQWA